MRIAQVSPLIESAPPATYGGTERVVHYLTEELHRLGHQVTLFASGDSRTDADHVAVVDRSLRTSSIPRDSIDFPATRQRFIRSPAPPRLGPLAPCFCYCSR